jgi:hypothetical protein
LKAEGPARPHAAAIAKKVHMKSVNRTITSLAVLRAALGPSAARAFLSAATVGL